MTKTEFDNQAAKLGGRMVSLDPKTRQQAAKDAAYMLGALPRALRNSPHCQSEIRALNTLIVRVNTGAY